MSFGLGGSSTEFVVAAIAPVAGDGRGIAYCFVVVAPQHKPCSIGNANDLNVWQMHKRRLANFLLCANIVGAQRAAPPSDARPLQGSRCCVCFSHTKRKLQRCNFVALFSRCRRCVVYSLPCSARTSSESCAHNKHSRNFTVCGERQLHAESCALKLSLHLRNTTTPIVK